MKRSLLSNDLILLVAALIWGFAFVAQRAGMQFIEPFTYIAIRYAMGGLLLIPLLKRKQLLNPIRLKANLFPGIIMGTILFLASAFQQFGIVYTTAGNAGFITGLYVIFVPIVGYVIGRKTGTGIWLGAVLAVIGLYFLNSTVSVDVTFGNFLVFIGSLFWTLHVLIIDRFTFSKEPLLLAAIQFLVCAFFSALGMAAFESPSFAAVYNALIPLLYAGFISSGIGFTLQVVAQKNAHPTHAAIILGLESVFAVIGGILILNEVLSINTFIGCALMLLGMIISQLWQRRKR